MLVLILWLRGCDLGTMWEEFRGFVNLRNDRTSCAPISVTLVLTLISIYLNSTHLMFHFNLVLFPKCLTLKSSVRTHFSENSAVFMGYPRLHKNDISDSMDDQWLTMHIWSTFSSMLACAYYYRLVTHPLCEWLHKRQIACGVLFIIKTLPKAQWTRGLSSYHKLHTNFDQTSFSESRLSIKFRISTKHQHLD